MKQFETTDMGQVCALVTKNYHIHCTDKTDPKRIRFYFEYQQGIEKVAYAYITGTLQLPARQFFDNIRAIKSLIRK